MARTKSEPGPNAEMTYEQAMSRLDEIVQALEDTRLPLEEMVDRYEEGGRLVKICQFRLDSAQQRIEVINRRASSDVSLTPVDDAAAPAPAGRAPRAKTSSPPTTSTDEIRLF